MTYRTRRAHSRRTLAVLCAALLLPAALLGWTTAANATATGARVATSLVAHFPATGKYHQNMVAWGYAKPWRNPTGSGRTLHLQRWTGKTWIDVGRKVLTGNDWKATFSTSMLGTYTYRAFLPALSNAAKGVSSYVHITTSKYTSHISATVSNPNAAVNTTVTIKGRISGGWVAGRVVQLQRNIPSGPRLERTTKSNANGYYSMNVPSWFFNAMKVRVLTPAIASSTGAVTSWANANVHPGFDVSGTASDHKFLQAKFTDGSYHKLRWNGCNRTITYRVNPGGNSTFLKRAKQAASRLRQAIGINLKYLGTTSKVPGGAGTWPANTGIVIAYINESATSWNWNVPAGHAIGLTTATQLRAAKDHSGTIAQILHAGVVLRKNFSWSTSTTWGVNTWGQTLQHELGHAVGMDHVNTASEIMNPSSTRNFHYQRGDLTGLRQEGYNGGCTWVPKGWRTNVHPLPQSPIS